jgi:hypothetical protein
VSGGAFAGFADGSLRWLGNDLDTQTCRQVSEPTDGEQLQPLN